MRKLALALNIPLYAANGLMERLWHTTAKYAPQGNIGKWKDNEIAIHLAWPVEESQYLVAALIDTGWLDVHDEYRLLVHDWADHAEDSVRTILNHHALRFATGEKPRNTESEASERATTPTNSQAFEDFWLLWPSKINKRRALEAWAKLDPAPELVATIRESVPKHHQQWKQTGSIMPGAANWLRDERWKDEPPDYAAKGADEDNPPLEVEREPTPEDLAILAGKQ